MKNLRNFALAAFALLGFAACQQEEFAPEIKNPTHSVTFVAGAPETKTTVTIDGNTAKFAWTEYDESRFTVYENGTAAKETIGVLGKDGKMTLSATFDGITPASPSYQALYNTAVSSTQTANDLYDETADVLVSAVLNDIDRDAVSYFSFKRESAIAKMTLKDLTDGAFVSSVTINSDKAIAGKYDLAKGSFSSTSNTITITSLSKITGGEATVWFASVPVEGATFTVTATAVDNNDNVVATYTKTFSNTITLTRGDVKGFRVAMVKDPKDLTFDFKTHPSGWPTSKTEASSAADYVYTLNGIDYTFSCPAQAYCGGTTETSGYLLVPSSSAMGLPAISGYKLVKVVGTLNDSGSPSPSSSISITTDGTNVVNGGTGQTWSKKGSEYTYSLVDTEEGQVYYFTVSNKNCQMIKLVLTYEPAFARPNLATPTNLAVSDEKVVSWDAVDGAASYVLTIGTEEYPCTSNSYDAKDIADEYYDVAVVAVPSDTENYKNSVAATLSGAKFGTPTLPTPTISAGVLEETSVTFSWTKDARATNGYHWALYNGEILIKEADETSATTAEVTGLVFGTTYTAKVYALAVDGDKPYVQSSTASFDLTTKAKTTISTIFAAGTGTTKYAIADLTVMAVNGSNFVVKDETGLMFCYKYGATVGDVVTLEGTFEEYQGLKEFKATTYKKASTASVDYGTATELNSSNVAAYVKNPVVQYVKAKATVASDGSLKVGDVALYQYGNSLASYAGRTINLYGYTLGYNTEWSNIVLLQTSVEIDQTVPYLAVEPTSKTWSSDETTAAVFNVTTNTEGVKDWSVLPTELNWAKIVIDKATGKITVTPNDVNTEKTPREATLTVTHSAGDLSETITLTQKAAGAPADVTETIDFESASSAYTSWTFTNMTSNQTGTITAHGGTYYGTTGGNATASITTKAVIKSPKSITFYVSKQSTNTTSSSWKIQVSSDKSTWTDVKTQSATTMSKGSWVKVTQDLSSYSNVYVRVYYTGSTAVRNIDDLSLTYSN